MISKEGKPKGGFILSGQTIAMLHWIQSLDKLTSQDFGSYGVIFWHQDCCKNSESQCTETIDSNCKNPLLLTLYSCLIDSSWLVAISSRPVMCVSFVENTVSYVNAVVPPTEAAVGKKINALNVCSFKQRQEARTRWLLKIISDPLRFHDLITLNWLTVNYFG